MSKKVDYKDLRERIQHRVHAGRGIYYEIVFVNDFKDGKTLGETRFHSNQIAIKSGLTDKLTVDTYCHELLHLYSFTCDANLTENQVLALEKSFYYLFKDGNIFKKKKRKNVKKTKK